MAGPADYMRIQGPLGGANFMSASEYDAINPNSPGNRVIATMQQGANLGSTVASTQGQDLRNQAQKLEIDDVVQKKADQEAVIGTMVAARSARLPQQQVAPAPAVVQPQPMVIPQAQPAAQVEAPVAQPQVAAQAPAVAQPQPANTPAVQTSEPAPQVVEVTGKRMTPEAKVAFDASNPPQSLPPTAAAPTAAAKGPLTQAQDFLSRASETESDFQKDTKFIQDKLGRGEITPRQAQLTLDTLRARRDAETARDTEYAGKLDKLQTQFAEGKLTREDARIKLADLNRTHTFDLAAMVRDDLASAGPEQARQTARENGLDPDTYIGPDGKPTKKLDFDANKSPQFIAREKAKAAAVAAAAKEAREEAKSDREGAKSEREDARLELERRKVEAAEAKARRNPAVQPDGRVSIVKEDAQGNRIIPKDVVNEIQQVDSNARLADSLLKTTDELVADDYKLVKAAPSSTVGNLISDAAGMTDITKGSATKARETLQRATNQSMSLLASIDPRAKGAPSNADIEGIKKIFNDPNTSAEEKIAAINTVRGWAQLMQKQRETSFSSIDDESRSLLKPFGIDAGTPSAGKPQAGGSAKTFTLATVQEAAKRSGKTETQIIKALEAAGGKLVQ